MSNSTTLAERRLRAARQELERDIEIRAERFINKLRAALIGSGCLLDVIAATMHGRPDMAVIIAVVGATLLAATVVTHRLLRGDRYRPWLKYATTSVDFGVIAGVYLLYSQGTFIADPRELSVPFFGVLALAIMASALRAGRVIVAYGALLGVLATAGHYLLFEVTGSVAAYEAGILVMVAALAALLSSMRVDTMLRLERRNQLTRFLPRPLVDAVDHGQLDLELGGTTVVVTVLMTDIRGFTTRSESMDPQELVSWLNRFLTTMTGVIHAHGGIVDKYIGDAILAVFGAPEPDPDHASHALAAALAMQQALDGFNRDASAQPVAIGIGLHSGPVVAGNVGSPERMDYTVMGDTVNTVARIESLTKSYGQPILVSEATRGLLGDEVQLVEVADADIRGRQQKMRLYAPKPA